MASDEILNYCRIHQLLTKAAEQLHRIFRERWKDYQKLNQENINEWNDDEECGMKLAQLCSSAAAPMKELMKSGRIDLWDITLTNLAIQAVSKEIRKCGGATDATEDSSIDRVRELRNQIAHGKSELSANDFEALWNDLTTILVQLGEKAVDIDEIKRSLMNIGLTKVEVMNDDAKTELSKLKEKANKLFKAEESKSTPSKNPEEEDSQNLVKSSLTSTAETATEEKNLSGTDLIVPKEILPKKFNRKNDPRNLKGNGFKDISHRQAKLLEAVRNNIDAWSQFG